MFSSNLLYNVLGILIATFMLIVVFFKKRYNYWKNLGIEYVEPSFPFGNMKESVLGRQSPGEMFEELYHTLKARKLTHGGCYMFYKPVYFPIDLIGY